MAFFPQESQLPFFARGLLTYKLLSPSHDILFSERGSNICRYNDKASASLSHPWKFLPCLSTQSA